MSDYDYIITIDENGSPSLQHALFGSGNAKGSQRQNHKYYARAQDKGRWRYFYSPEEFRAWSSGATRKVKQTVNNAKNAVNNAAGEVRKSVNARKALNEANKATGFGSGLKQWNAQRKYNQTAMGKAEQELRKKAGNLKTDVQSKAEDVEIAANKASKRAQKKFNDLKTDVQSKAEDVEIAANKASKQAKKKIKNLTDAVKEHGSKTLSELRNAASNAGNRVGDKLGLDEREALENANFLNRGRRQKAYDATPMGKAEKAAKNAADRVRDTTDDLSDRVRDTAGKARNVANEAARKVKDKANDVAGRVGDRLGTDEREALENSNFLNRGRRQKAYDATPLGKAENTARGAADRVRGAADAVSDKASDIRDRIRGLADSAGSAARGAAGRVRDAAGNAASSARNAVDNASGAAAKKEMDAQGRKALMGLDDVIGDFMDSKVRYENSAAGKTASARSNAEAAMKSAQAAAKKALAKAMDYLPDEQIEEIKDLIRGK